MFVKGEHERQFAYTAQTACDKHGFVLGYEVAAGNIHDSISFEGVYEKIRKFNPCMLVADCAYKTPAILRKLFRTGTIPNMPRVDPKTGKGFFRKYEYAYDEYYDCYLCPNHQVLSYSTTNRDGYREYKSKANVCKDCPYLSQYTNSRDHVKVVTRHMWSDYLEFAEDFRLTLGMKEVYNKRKETIERIFADAKDKHGMRYTQYRGLAKVRMQVGLTFACMNLKKLAIGLGKSSVFLQFLMLFELSFLISTEKKDLDALLAC